MGVAKWSRRDKNYIQFYFVKNVWVRVYIPSKITIKYKQEPKLTSHCKFVTFYEAKIMWNNSALFSCLLYISLSLSHDFIFGGRDGRNFRSLILQTNQIGCTKSVPFLLPSVLRFFQNAMQSLFYLNNAILAPLMGTSSRCRLVNGFNHHKLSFLFII